MEAILLDLGAQYKLLWLVTVGPNKYIIKLKNSGKEEEVLLYVYYNH